MASISFRGNNYALQVGDNRGSIDFHLPPVRPETPPSPLSTVPFARDTDFVSRDTLLHQIHEKNSAPGSRIALVGLGGVGKSQLAIEYSYQVRSQSPATWVFWVHASNDARFEQSFRDIADQIKIQGRQDPQVNIFKLVENWLLDESRGKWLLILDNVDNDQLLCSFSVAGREDPISSRTNASTKPLLEYIPKSRNGSVIITSRAREVALKMAIHKNLIEIKPMEESEALELLQRKLDQPRENKEGLQLMNALEFMPLAIVQAASYILQRESRYSVSQYLQDFQGSDCEAIRLLKKEAGHLYRDWEAKNSILVTWQISFDYIRQTTPSAADLLSLMSLFDRQGIPENLIQYQPKASNRSISEHPNNFDNDDDDTSESDIGPDFEDDITTLRGFSFISISEDNTSFTMHRLVQLTMRAWLKSHKQINQFRERFIRILCDEFPTGEFENWERCRPLFPHVRAAMSQRPLSTKNLQEWATLLYRGAWYAWQSGNIADTREMAARSREQRMILLGQEHEEALNSTGMLAIAYWLDGRWEEAEQLFVQVMKTRKTKLGEDHPDTLTSMANLASTYWKQGRWEKAEQLEVQVMETRKTKLGEDHPDTLSSMANLASTYRKQGRWEKAEQLEVQVMETRKTKLGEDHPDTLSSMANLASTYRKQGRWEKAEQLEVQVMKTRKTKLGEDHPDTLTSMANLAATYWNQGRWEKAEQLDVQVMKTRKTKLGEDHPDTLTSMANLASTYWNQGRWEKAEQLEVQVMKTRKTKLGEDHPDTLTSMANLALTYWNQGRWEKAEQLFVQVMETSKTKLGEDHPDTLTSMANLALTYWNQGRWEKAEQLEVQVMETSKTKLGEDHPNTLTSMANLAATYRNQGRWEKAEQLFVQVMETSKTKLGEDHPDTLSSMANLAFTWKSSAHDAEAINLLRECLAKQKQILGLNHPLTLSHAEILLKWETDEESQTNSE
ncbi:uncharacterized protein N7483_002471 [Penicillium malachiteum]|uniref:uncharacterized protein n=1 Tax=Penicillium malachiteum TaxID=1324776 RepID=UPI002547C847|nr:uncharacterized protein N7483_002471 [Penicillium malachiteum]KAJ5737346.1 hypothetical protein N7483_002471 [Penicillium malachiteum]